MTGAVRGLHKPVAMRVAPRAAIGVGLATMSAYAQSSGEAEFSDGRELMARGRYREACAAFDGSQRIGPGLTTLMNGSACREKNQPIATAWSTFLKTAALAQSERESLLEEKSHAAALEPRLSKLVPTDARVPELVITRDGPVLDSALWSRAVHTDGSMHTIAASGPGRAACSTQIMLGIERDSGLVVPTLPVEPASGSASSVGEGG